MHLGSLSRRALLAGGAASVLQACAPAPQGPAGTPEPSGAPARPGPPVSPVPPGSPATPLPQPTARATPRSIGELLRGEFVVAHRGSGDNWPEHTLTAYLNGNASGADAVEISVRATADGVLVCHHDSGTYRVTGIDGELRHLTLRQLSSRRVDARGWLGDATPLEPISPLAEVLGALPEDCLIFIEDKDGTNTHALLDLLDAQPRATERFVWKQWAVAQQVHAARERGYHTWGFFTEDILHRVEEVLDLHDALGVPVATADEEIARVVGLGKPVMAWEVHTRHERDRLRSLGVAGLMCSNVPHVLATAAPASSDAFATGARPAGDLPATYAFGWHGQPRLTPGMAAVTLHGESRYLLGSMAPIATPEFRLTFTVGWEGSPSSGDARAGMALCLPDDGPYHPRHANPSGSYQVYLGADGQVALSYQAAGWTASEKLAAIEQAAGELVEISVSVAHQKLTLEAAGQSVSVNHMDARGGYLWLWGEQISDGARFSDIRVTQL